MLGLGLSNPVHIAFLVLIVLLVFGAKRLPELGSSLGDGLRGFKESVSGESDRADAAQTSNASLTVASTPVAESGPGTVTEAARTRQPA